MNYFPNRKKIQYKDIKSRIKLWIKNNETSSQIN